MSKAEPPYGALCSRWIGRCRISSKPSERRELSESTGSLPARQGGKERGKGVTLRL